MDAKYAMDSLNFCILSYEPWRPHHVETRIDFWFTTSYILHKYNASACFTNTGLSRCCRDRHRCQVTSLLCGEDDGKWWPPSLHEMIISASWPQTRTQACSHTLSSLQLLQPPRRRLRLCHPQRADYRLSSFRREGRRAAPFFASLHNCNGQRKCIWRWRQKKERETENRSFSPSPLPLFFAVCGRKWFDSGGM